MPTALKTESAPTMTDFRDSLRSPKRGRSRSRMAAAVAILAAWPAFAGDPGPLAADAAVWTAADAAKKDRFGAGLAIHGDRVAIGAPYADGGREESGIVYVFDAASGEETSRIAFDPGEAAIRMGRALALTDKRLVVGLSNLYAGDGGADVYVREGDGWTREARLRPEAAQAWFGASVALENGRLLIAAPGHPRRGDGGAVHVYEREGDTWAHTARIEPQLRAEGEIFGVALAADGDRVLIGARTGKVGAAYLFAHAGKGWAEQAHFEKPEPAGVDGFGESLDLAGPTALIGARFAKDDEGNQVGAAYVFREDGDAWTHQATLHSDAPSARDQFGAAVALVGGMAVVSSPRDDAEARDAGAVLVFETADGDWPLAGRLPRPVAPEEYDEYGRALAARPGMLIVGSPQDTGTASGVWSGTATAYQW